MSKLMKATVISTGKEVEVYRLMRGGYCDFSDCKTEYSETEVKILGRAE